MVFGQLTSEPATHGETSRVESAGAAVMLPRSRLLGGDARCKRSHRRYGLGHGRDDFVERLRLAADRLDGVDRLHVDAGVEQLLLCGRVAALERSVNGTEHRETGVLDGDDRQRRSQATIAFATAPLTPSMTVFSPSAFSIAFSMTGMAFFTSAAAVLKNVASACGRLLKLKLIMGCASFGVVVMGLGVGVIVPDGLFGSSRMTR